jgi:hypothetical protein
MMRRSLGSCVAGAAGRGITLSSATNATPIVATLGALHGIPSQTQAQSGAMFEACRRYTIFGCTGGTGINGMWSLTATGTNTFSLDGSVAPGAVTATNAVVALLMDRTPFMQGHSAVAFIRNAPDMVAIDGTFAVMGSIAGYPAYGGNAAVDGATDAEILAASSATLATYFESCVTDVAFEVPGATNDGSFEMRNVKLRKHMYLDLSAWTAGGIVGDLLA